MKISIYFEKIFNTNQFYVTINILIGKDKSRLSMEVDQFQLKSSIMQIYDKFETIDGVPNFDVCLIKTESDENGIQFDLSAQFDHIPCFSKMLNLEEVFSLFT